MHVRQLTDKFLDLLLQSVIVQASLTMTFALIIAYLLVVGRVVPSEVWTSFGAILGYWFGTRQAATLTPRSSGRNGVD